MRQIVCFCEQSFEIDFPDIINLENNDIFNSIISGDFMSVICPNCKTVLKPELPFRLVDSPKKIDIFFIPEIDRTSFLIDKLAYNINNPNRVVIGYRELVEKLQVINARLNDQAIEIIKYYILSKAKEKNNNKEIKIYFNDYHNDTILFYIEGLKKDEIGKYEIKMDFYNKILIELDNKINEPSFASFLQPPYVSLNRVEME